MLHTTTFGVATLLAMWFLKAAGEDFASPLVFDPTFYVNTNPDLYQHGIHTTGAARTHWLTNGIREGRQGCGSFHSKQYLHRYDDLSEAFGSNYHQAVQHYLDHQNEKRLGYVEGGYNGRWTISNQHHDLFISASARMGGAIDSLVWDNKEFINAWDHGRGLQMATNTHVYGECFNPTEAGNRNDGTGPATTSTIMNVTASANILKTTNHPAFWLRHGDHQTQELPGSWCTVNSPALNLVDRYDYDFSKTVTIGCAALTQCIKYESTFTIGGLWPMGYIFHNFEAPTGYLTGEFSIIKSLNLANGQLEPYNNRYPIILSTVDYKHAMGAYSPAGQDTDLYQYYSGHWFGNAFASGTSKWGSVFRKNAFQSGSLHKVTYITYICVGTLDQVTECVRKLHVSSG